MRTTWDTVLPQCRHGFHPARRRFRSRVCQRSGKLPRSAVLPMVFPPSRFSRIALRGPNGMELYRQHCSESLSDVRLQTDMVLANAFHHACTHNLLCRKQQDCQGKGVLIRFRYQKTRKRKKLLSRAIWLGANVENVARNLARDAL